MHYTTTTKVPTEPPSHTSQPKPKPQPLGIQTPDQTVGLESFLHHDFFHPRRKLPSDRAPPTILRQHTITSAPLLHIPGPLLQPPLLHHVAVGDYGMLRGIMIQTRSRGPYQARNRFRELSQQCHLPPRQSQSWGGPARPTAPPISRDCLRN